MVWDRGSIFLHVCSYCCSCMSPAVLADTPHTDTQQADFKVCISDQPHICFSRSHDSLTYSGTHCCFIIFTNSHAGSVFWVSPLNSQYLTCSLSNKGCLACSWVYWFTSRAPSRSSWHGSSSVRLKDWGPWGHLEKEGDWNVNQEQVVLHSAAVTFSSVWFQLVFFCSCTVTVLFFILNNH